MFDPSPEVVVRSAAPTDLDLLRAMVERTSPTTLRRRFHDAAGRPVQRELARIASPTPSHRSWVALAADGQVHGTATLAWARAGTVEAAFLVEDAWFRRGLGRALFGALAIEAARARVATVLATVQADNDRAVRFLRAVAPGAHPRFVGGGELEVAIPVRVGAVEVPAPAGRAA